MYVVGYIYVCGVFCVHLCALGSVFVCVVYVYVCFCVYVHVWWGVCVCVCVMWYIHIGVQKRLFAV